MNRTALILLIVFSPSIARAAPVKVHANGMAELTFQSAADHADPFNDVTLDVVFTEPGGRQLRVPAFWDGGKTWKVRYASGVVGAHAFRSECSDPKDAGLQNQQGEVDVEPYTGTNPLYVHGPVRVKQGARYLEHVDGTPFFWLGDTWWMGLTKRLAFPEEFKELTADRVQKGFTVVQIVAGLYPDMAAFDERGANDAGFPWEKDYARIRPEYFDAADKKIEYLADQGIAPCVVGAWGFHLPWLGVEKMKRHERYLYARWGALPMIWCVAGELNLPYYGLPGFPYGAEKQTAGWEEVIKYCHTINAFDRPISAHPTGVRRLSMREALSDAKVLDFDMIQTPHGQMEAIAPTVNAVRYSYGCTPPLPVVNAEPSYEMLFDRTPAEVVRAVFWVCWASGVKGYTYGASGIWQMNGKDKPYGTSASGANYGGLSWDKAMKLAGSTQVALGKKFLSQFAWQDFEPQPTWAEWSPANALDAPLGDWIWYPEGDPALAAPVGKVYLRTTFAIPAGVTASRVTVRATADDRAVVFLNGERIGATDNWKTLGEFEVPAAKLLAGKLLAGKNVLAIEGENVDPSVAKNPAGAICGLTVELPDRRVEVKSGADWKASRESPAGWNTAAFDDSGWPAAKVAAPNGGGPWGRVGAADADPYIVPYATGIAGKVRVVYVPKASPVVVTHLEPGVRYAASVFDPVTGERTALSNVAAEANGTSTCAPPAWSHDWVLVLEAN